MPHRILITTALCACMLALASCKPASDTATPGEPAAPAANAAVQSAGDAHSTDVISEVDNASAPADFDARAFAGSFKGTLPCASCAGIDTTLDLKADGSYALHETYQDEKNTTLDSDGTWTAEDNGKKIRLDPNSKTDTDHLYGVVSTAELQLLDMDGAPAQSGADGSLKRAGVAK